MSDHPMIAELRALVEEHDRFMNGLPRSSPSVDAFEYYLDLINRIARTSDAALPLVANDEAADVLAEAFRTLGFAVLNWCVLIRLNGGSRTPVADVVTRIRPLSGGSFVAVPYPFAGPRAEG